MSATRFASAFTHSLRAATPRLAAPSARLGPTFPSAAWSSRLRPSRPFTSSPSRFDAPPSSASSSSPTPDATAATQVPVGPTKTPIGRIEKRLQITFTCTAAVPVDGRSVAEIEPGEEVDGKACGHRSTHQFSKRSYEKGIVLIECPGCKNRHLIADNLEWFSQTPSPAHPAGLAIGDKRHRTVEDLVKEKGEKVKWLDGGDQGGTWMLE